MTHDCVAGKPGPGGVPACDPLFHRWVHAGELVLPRTDVLPPLVEALCRRHGCPPAVAAAMFWKQYAWFVVAAALEGWTTGPVPDLALDGTAIWIGCEGRTVQVRPGARRAGRVRPDGQDGEHRYGVVEGPPVSDGTRDGEAGPADREFTGWFRTEVMKGHLEPVLEHLHELTRAGRRLLWGSVAHAVALPLSRRLADPVRDVPELLERIGAPLAGLVHVADDGAITRRTCCLAFRMPTPAVCDYCPITSADCAPLDRAHHPPRR